MSEQLALTIVAATVGFASAVFFCVGNALNAPEKILLQATPFWGFSKPVARALTAQRAQYIVGAMLLFATFIFQLAAALASAEAPAPLPSFLRSWPALILCVLVSVSLLSAGLAWAIYRTTIAKVLSLEIARKQENERATTAAKVAAA